MRTHICFHTYTYRMYIHIRSIYGTLGTNGWSNEFKWENKCPLGKFSHSM